MEGTFIQPSKSFYHLQAMIQASRVMSRAFASPSDQLLKRDKSMHVLLQFFVRHWDGGTIRFRCLAWGGVRSREDSAGL